MIPGLICGVKSASMCLVMKLKVMLELIRFLQVRVYGVNKFASSTPPPHPFFSLPLAPATFLHPGTLSFCNKSGKRQKRGWHSGRNITLSFCQQQQRDQERAGVCRHGSVRRITVNNVQCCWEFPPSNSSESWEAFRSQLSDKDRKKQKGKSSVCPQQLPKSSFCMCVKQKKRRRNGRRLKRAGAVWLRRPEPRLGCGLKKKAG